MRTLNVPNQLTEFYEFVIQEERRKLTMAAALAQVRNALQAIGIVDVELIKYSHAILQFATKVSNCHSYCCWNIQLA